MASQNQSERAKEVIDNIVSAMGKIVIYHLPSLIDMWLPLLPLKVDIEEARDVHKLFLDAVVQRKVKGDQALLQKVIGQMQQMSMDYFYEES